MYGVVVGIVVVGIVVVGFMWLQRRDRDAQRASYQCTRSAAVCKGSSSV